MKKVIIVRYGEIMLKGQNKPIFESKLVSNIKKALSGMDKVSVVKNRGRIYVEPESDGFNFSLAVDKLKKVFGIVSVSIAEKMAVDLDAIKAKCVEIAKELYATGLMSFKVETRRADKNFPMESPKISAEIGMYVLDSIPGIRVDVTRPDFTLYVEIREDSYVYSEIIRTDGGMPVGTNGKALLLISGGIDSPVAGWMMGKRGVRLSAVHFYSYPYTSERALQKVIDLCGIVSTYCGKVDLHIVPFTDIQLEINQKCPPEYGTIVMRRVMMNIACRIAKETGALALVTGESVGQVASQTIHGLYATDAAADMPVFRPLIGMDKNEIVDIARRIGTFETSILPYEDCCTVFVAKHPATKPRLEKVLEIEAGIDFEPLIQKALTETRIV